MCCSKCFEKLVVVGFFYSNRQILIQTDNGEVSVTIKDTIGEKQQEKLNTQEFFKKNLQCL